ncbi:2Fe-2S iron-sulfur cluster-binding protein [Streptomyces sp. NPDC001796]|uniref:2Fe-2S iron-sulfur cluster-binding protein n=1 Tax=Streptomyces sp. NPDC001796 TaxID=3364609 RepID=UPI003695A043
MTAIPLGVPRRLVEFTLDEQEVRVPEGSTILDACRAAGKDVPTLWLWCGLQPHAARAGQ